MIDIEGMLPSFTPSFSAMEELFDERGNARPLCPDCRKPYPEGTGDDKGLRPYCPHCGRYQSVRECPSCKRWCSLAAKFCSRCGTSLGNWKCEECGGAATEWMEKFPPIPPHGFFCIRCGARIWDPTTITEIENFYSYWHEKRTKTFRGKMTEASRKKASPAIPPVKAKWYTGMLKIPDGACVKSYTRTGFGANYEKHILVHVQKGCVTKTETLNDKTLKHLADLWIRTEEKGKRVDALFTAIKKRLHLSPSDGEWQFPDSPPPQLKQFVVVARLSRKLLLSDFDNFPKFLRAKLD